MLTKHIEEASWNYTRMLCAILNIYWKQHPQNSSCMATWFPSYKTIPIRWTRRMILLEKQEQNHEQHFLMDPYTQICQCWPTSMNLSQLCTDSGCSLEDLLGMMNDRDKSWEGVKELCALSTTWLSSCLS